MPDDDVQRVDQLRNGNQAALGELFTAYRPRLRRMLDFRIDKRLKQRVDVEDVLQESWLSIAQRLPHFLNQPPQASCYVWMRLVAAQTLTDIHRRHLATQSRDAGREFSFDRMHNPAATSQSIADFLLARGTSPTQAVARAEAAAQVREVVSGLDPTDQEILALRHFEELSNSEVAQVLEISIAAASTRYIRALKKLQDVLKRFPDLV